MLENSSKISPAFYSLGEHLNIIADFSLNAADMKMKYLFVSGVIINLLVLPRYSFY